jgi:hypothetical protein
VAFRSHPDGHRRRPKAAGNAGEVARRDALRQGLGLDYSAGEAQPSSPDRLDVVQTPVVCREVAGMV